MFSMCEDAARHPTSVPEGVTNFWIGAGAAPFFGFGPNTTTQTPLIRYGPFRNVGGGDAEGSLVYIWFYIVRTD